MTPIRPPASVTVTGAVRFTPNELRALKAETGRGLQEMLGPEADDGDRMQTLAWLRLRREGTPLAWDACGDIEVIVEAEAPADPTNGVPSMSLPVSADSGA